MGTTPVVNRSSQPIFPERTRPPGPPCLRRRPSSEPGRPQAPDYSFPCREEQRRLAVGRVPRSGWSEAGVSPGLPAAPSCLASFLAELSKASCPGPLLDRLEAMAPRWWEESPSETYWVEITDREDLGVDLAAPTFNRRDGRSGATTSYGRSRKATSCCTTSRRRAHTAWPRAVGQPYADELIWVRTAEQAGAARLLRTRDLRGADRLPGLSLWSRP